MTSTSAPTQAPRRRAPSGLKSRGKAFWAATTTEFDLSGAELEILAEVARTLDTLDALAVAVERDGPMVSGSTGQPVLNPAVTEARGQRVVLHRLLAALALPDEDGGQLVVSARSASGKAAARARWSGVQTEAGIERAAAGA